MNAPVSAPLLRQGALKKGSALVITLFFLVLIAIMILSMSDSSRIERGASVSYLNELLSSQMAERGLNHVTATLNKETADINRNWISQPGQLVIGAEQDNQATVPLDERKVLTGAVENETSLTAPKIIPLHSGVPSGTTPSSSVLEPPDLNVSGWESGGERLIIDKPVSLRVKWVYVRQDGTLETSEAPDLTSTTNPIIGRYAFWADDESTKVNLNLAWSAINPQNTSSPASPTRISLAGLSNFTEDDATTLHQYVTSDNFATLNGFFNTPNDARRTSALASKLRENKFNVTHYNHDPQTTFFNEKRIVLTTQKKYAGNNPFLDILKDDNTDPGRVSVTGTTSAEVDVISASKLDSTLKMLVGYLKRSDWPMVPATATNKSFQAKYFSGTDSRLAQLAIGIIEYVRSVESEKVLIEPIRVKWDAGTQTYTRVSGSKSPGADDTFIGSPRRIHMTEFAIWRADQAETDSSSPVYGKVKIKLYVELHLTANGGIDSVDLLEPEPGKKLFMYIFQADQAGYAFNADGKDAFEENGKSSFYEIKQANIIGGAANRTLPAGGYRTIVFEFYYKYKTNPIPNPAPFDVRYALSIGNTPDDARWANRIEIAPLGNPPAKDGSTIGFPVTIQSPAGIPEPAPNTLPNVNLGSMITDDPRVNHTYHDWRSYSEHSLGAVNPESRLNSTATSTGSGKPPRDYITSGSQKRVTDIGLRVPYPKGHPSNSAGIVKSPAELGFVHTGLEGKAQGTQGGVSWRSLRLQASTGTSITDVPDWALMDLFTVPSEVSPAAAELLSPHGTGAGRININNAVKPFDIPRTAPLRALLLNARTDVRNANLRLTSTEVDTIVENIRNFTVSGQNYGYLKGYDSPGEIVEIKGIADTGEEREELVRSLCNQITTRSNVFGVYTVGQALRQTGNTLLVIGEQRQHAILERYLDGNTVRFRTVYVRNISP